MNLSLNRFEYNEDGIIGHLVDEDGKYVAYTLEHAYLNTGVDFEPKVPRGTYTCKRGQHTLHSVPNGFETFEILNVPGHTGILFHPGNYNNDSDGCVLLGTALLQTGSGKMITSSRLAFQGFMALQEGIDKFQLTVAD